MTETKREKIIKIRVSAEEHQQLEANKTIPSLARWIRETALNPNVDMFAVKADEELIRELAKIGNNLNQVARKINQSEWGPSDRLPILAALKLISDEMETFRDR